VKFHPFADGNGRTARLIMNYQLLKNNFPAISISQNDKLKYFEALEEYAINSNIEPFASMVAELSEKRILNFLNTARL
jgi:Fic family protein